MWIPKEPNPDDYMDVHEYAATPPTTEQYWLAKWYRLWKEERALREKYEQLLWRRGEQTRKRELRKVE